MVNTARSRNTSDCCESILVTTGLRGRKSKPPPSHKTRGWGTQTSKPKTSPPETSIPELQHPKSQHLNFNTQNLNTRTSTPKISTLKFQKPEFKITRKSGLSYRMLHTARSTRPQPFALSSWARRSHSVDTLGWMGAYNSAHPPAHTRTGVKLCPTPGNSGRAR